MKKDSIKTTADESIVGTFVKTQSSKGANLYGLVTDVFNGQRVGFVHSEGDTWTSELVWCKDIAPCENDAEASKASQSAIGYFKNEVDDLRSRIAQKYEFDDQQKLASMLADCEAWLSML